MSNNLNFFFIVLVCVTNISHLLICKRSLMWKTHKENFQYLPLYFANIAVIFPEPITGNNENKMSRALARSSFRPSEVQGPPPRAGKTSTIKPRLECS